MRQRALAQHKSCGPRSSGRLAKVMLEVVDRLVIEASRLKKSIEIKLDDMKSQQPLRKMVRTGWVLTQLDGGGFVLRRQVQNVSHAR